MSFNSQMHGSLQGQSSFSYNDSQPLFQDVSDATTIKINTLQAKLNQKLGPEYISQRPGPGGGKLTYAEGWKIINLANEVFGFNGWSSNVINLTTDFIDFNEESKKFTVGVTAVVRVTLRDGVFHEDVGYGMLENSKSKGAALDKVSSLLLIINATHKYRDSARKRLSRTRSNVLCAILEISLETVCMISHTLKKSSR
jgi:DNA repair and recombination protein RAD52